MKKVIPFVIIIVFLTLISFKLFVSWMSPVYKEIKAELVIPESKMIIRAYYVDGGATTTNTILVTQKKKFRKEKKINHFSKYDDVKEFKLINEYTIKAVFSMGNESSSLDTFYVKIN